MNGAATVRRLIEHDAWANRKLMDAIDAAGERALPALRRMAHVVAAHEMWQSRMGLGDAPDDLFPNHPDGGRVRAGLFRACDVWAGFVSGLDDEGLDREFEYTSTEGRTYRNRVADALLHVATHAAYHRGQMAVDLRGMLDEPVTQDLIALARLDG